jgi:hypothetical protein
MTVLEMLTQARDKAKADLIAAYDILNDGREIHLGYWEKRYTAACEELAGAQLATDLLDLPDTKK